MNTSTDLNVLIGQWESKGIITSEQGNQIKAETPGSVRPSVPRGSLITEALSYVGGALVLIATIIIAGIYWPELNITGRTAITGGAALLVLVAGSVLPEQMGAARIRLRAVLWALAVAMTGVCIGVVSEGLHWTYEDRALVSTGGAAALAIALWALQRSVLQQAAMGIAIVATVGTATALLPNDGEATVGLAIWGAGLAWLGLAWGGLLPPQRTGFLLGGIAVVTGSQLTTQHTWGLILAGATVITLVSWAVLARDLWLLGVGAVGVLITVPIIVNRYFPGELAAPLALLGAGIALIGLGLLTARRRKQPTPGTGLTTIPPWLAIAAAAVAIAATTPAVLTIGSIPGPL